MSLTSKLKATGKIISYSVLGALPEQDFITKELNKFGDWYNPYSSTIINGTIELILGIGYVSLGHGLEGLLIALDGGLRISPLAAEDDLNDPMFKTFSKKGSLALEVPWYITKNLGKGIYNMTLDLQNYYSKTRS